MSQILRRRAVIAKTGLSRATIQRLEAAGQFPARVKLGVNSVGWVEEEIDEWIAERRSAADAAIKEARARHTALVHAGAKRGKTRQAGAT